MDPSERVVASMPLAELWDHAGPVAAHRGRWLGAEDIRILLRGGPVRFVVADAGHKLRWVGLSECFAFWKAEAMDRICAGDAWSLEDYPGGYCYVAREWHLASGGVAVVLEKSH